MDFEDEDAFFAITNANIRRPPTSGPGSSREAWIAYAEGVEEANASLQHAIRTYRRAYMAEAARTEQAQKEVGRLQDEADARKPKGGRERLPKETVARILDAVRAGGSTRYVASVFHVSAMTVSRIKRKATS